MMEPSRNFTSTSMTSMTFSVKHETNKLRKEKEAFDKVAKKLEHVLFSKMLKLNVGGHMFTTSLETMTKDPGNLTVT